MEMIPKNRKRDGTSERLDILVTHLSDRPAQSQARPWPMRWQPLAPDADADRDTKRSTGQRPGSLSLRATLTDAAPAQAAFHFCRHHGADLACEGCPWSWMPRAAATLRMVARLGLPSPDVSCSDVHEAGLWSGQSRRASGHHNALVRIHIEPSFKGCKGV